jgi:hypothetical protein
MLPTLFEPYCCVSIVIGKARRLQIKSRKGNHASSSILTGYELAGRVVESLDGSVIFRRMNPTRNLGFTGASSGDVPQCITEGSTASKQRVASPLMQAKS